jgi:hypothetical protein
MSLDERVRKLEKLAAPASWCAASEGRSVIPVDRWDEFPLGADSRCLGCGAPVKLIDREFWEALR